MFRRRSSHVFSSKFQGFTLVESLLVASLICVISLAVYQTVAASLKIWQRYRSFKEGEVLVFFDKVNQELRNSIRYSKIPFEGHVNRVVFATMVKTPMDQKKRHSRDEWEEQIGRVEYLFDQQAHALYRRQANYSQALKNAYGPKKLVVNNLSSVAFSYYHRDGENLSERTETDHIPTVFLVKVTLNTPEKQQLTKHVHIPIGDQIQ